MPNITLCADDYGYNNEVSQGILTLIEKQRLHATSVIVNGKGLDLYGSQLKMASIQIGLHLNFTEGRPLSSSWKGSVFPNLPTLILKTYLRVLSYDMVYQEIMAQLDAFYRIFEKMPDFIDGHMHVHQFPIIREALIAIHQKENVYGWIRHTYSPTASWFSKIDFPKRQIINTLGGYRFYRLLQEYAIPTHTSFSGIYDLKKGDQYRTYFQHFLKESTDGGVIMCHPGLPGEENDSIALARQREFDYFMNDDYLEDIA